MLASPFAAAWPRRRLLAELAPQLRQFFLCRIDGQQRHAASVQHIRHPAKTVTKETRQWLAFPPLAHCDFHLQFALRDHQPTATRQLLRHRVENQHAQHVVVRRQQPQDAQGVVVRAGEIADDADQAIVRRVQKRAAQRTVQALLGRRIGPLGGQVGIRRRHCSQECTDPVAASQGFERPYPAIVEHKTADAVPSPVGYPRGNRGQPRRDGALECTHGAEVHAHALVHDDHRGTVTFLGVRTHERLAVAQRCAQVQAAQVITGHVTPKLRKIQPPAPQPGPMWAREHAAKGLVREKRQSARR